MVSAELRRFTEKSMLVDLRDFQKGEIIGVYLSADGRVQICSGKGLSLEFQNGELVKGEGPFEAYLMVEHGGPELTVEEVAYIRMLEREAAVKEDL